MAIPGPAPAPGFPALHTHPPPFSGPDMFDILSPRDMLTAHVRPRRNHGVDDVLLLAWNAVVPARPGAARTGHHRRVRVQHDLVALVGDRGEDRALGVTEIVAATEFYDYEAKYADGGSRHIVPAEIPPEIAESAMAYAVKAHQVLGCRGVSRSDFRFDDGPQARKKHGAGRLVFLEINTQPGMTPTSLLPEQAEAMGLSFNALVRWIIQDASCPR